MADNTGANGTAGNRGTPQVGEEYIIMKKSRAIEVLKTLDGLKREIQVLLK